MSAKPSKSADLLFAEADRLSRLIPNEPGKRKAKAVHRWAEVLKKAIKKGRSL